MASFDAPTTHDRTDRRADPVDLYLDLLKKCLTRSVGPDPYRPIDPMHQTWKRALYVAHLPVKRALGAIGVELVRRIDGDPALQEVGIDLPAQAETMIGMRRLDNLQACVEDVLARDVPGDLLEAGVWRGGASIFMRGVLEAHGDLHRTVWLADSFAGLPPPDVERYPSDAGDTFSRNPHLAVSLEEVQENFRRYGLLDERVRFLKGWFHETLRNAPVERLAVLRLDGDMYGSTLETLDALYDKVSPGGYVIVDDYYAVPEGAGRATDDFRAERGITEELVKIDWAGAYWQRLPA